MKPSPQPEAGIQSGDELVRILHEKARKTPLSGTASVRVSGRQKQSVNLSFIAKPPEGLRADVMTLFGIPLASLASDGWRLSVFQHGENRYFVGPVTAPAAREMLVVPLAPAEFVALVTGTPLLEGYHFVPGSFEAGKSGYGAHFRGPGGRVLTVVVSRDSLNVREIYYRFPERTLHIEFHSWRETNAGPMPERVTIDGGPDLQAELSLGNWNFTAAPANDVFFIPPPPGAQVYFFGAGAP